MNPALDIPAIWCMETILVSFIFNKSPRPWLRIFVNLPRFNTFVMVVGNWAMVNISRMRIQSEADFMRFECRCRLQLAAMQLGPIFHIFLADSFLAFLHWLNLPRALPYKERLGGSRKRNSDGNILILKYELKPIEKYNCQSHDLLLTARYWWIPLVKYFEIWKYKSEPI